MLTKYAMLNNSPIDIIFIGKEDFYTLIKHVYDKSLNFPFYEILDSAKNVITMKVIIFVIINYN